MKKKEPKKRFVPADEYPDKIEEDLLEEDRGRKPVCTCEDNTDFCEVHSLFA